MTTLDNIYFYFLCTCVLILLPFLLFFKNLLWCEVCNKITSWETRGPFDFLCNCRAALVSDTRSIMLRNLQIIYLPCATVNAWYDTWRSMSIKNSRTISSGKREREKDRKSYLPRTLTLQSFISKFKPYTIKKFSALNEIVSEALLIIRD